MQLIERNTVGRCEMLESEGGYIVEVFPLSGDRPCEHQRRRYRTFLSCLALRDPARHPFPSLGVLRQTSNLRNCQAVTTLREEERAIPVARNLDSHRKPAVIKGKKRAHRGGSFRRNVGRATSR